VHFGWQTSAAIIPKPDLTPQNPQIAGQEPVCQTAENDKNQAQNIAVTGL